MYFFKLSHWSLKWGLTYLWVSLCWIVSYITYLHLLVQITPDILTSIVYWGYMSNVLSYFCLVLSPCLTILILSQLIPVDYSILYNYRCIILAFLLSRFVGLIFLLSRLVRLTFLLSRLVRLTFLLSRLVKLAFLLSRLVWFTFLLSRLVRLTSVKQTCVSCTLFCLAVFSDG